MLISVAHQELGCVTAGIVTIPEVGVGGKPTL